MRGEGEEFVLEEAGILNSALRSSLEPSKVRDRFRYIIVARALLDCVNFKYIF